MKKLIFFILSLFLFISEATADDFIAKVDNNQVVAGEPFELQLVYSGNQNDIQPDLSVLQKDFRIYSNGSSMQTSFVNGVVNQQRSWIIGLIALKDGNISIPSIKAGNMSSESIDLTVLPAGSSVDKIKNKSTENVSEQMAKFETEFIIDEKNPYVKQEVTGTLVIKDYVGLEFMNEPVFSNTDDWTIKIIEQPEVSKIANGREIKVNFAMFPQKSGEQNIPSLQWQAAYYDMSETAKPKSFGFFDIGDFSMMRGIQKPVILQTKPQKISVKPIPAEYGDYSQWLPAKSLSLVSKWADNSPKFKAGETVSREIILSAAGILDSELPELEFNAPQNVKQYPENPKYSLNVYKNEPIAQATYRIVYIPQKSGEITLPAISLKWFNTRKGETETAKIAEQKIYVEKNPDFEELAVKSDNEKQFENQVTNKNIDEQPVNTKTLNNKTNLFLWLISAFGLGMLISYFLFSKQNIALNNKSKTLTKINNYLKNNDFRKLRDNLIKWGNENYHNKDINNLNDLAMLINEDEFSQQMQILNRIIYTGTDEKLEKSIILSALKNHSSDHKKSEAERPLPELY